MVDDSEEVLHLEKNMLEDLGYQVTCQTSPEKTVEIFRAKPDDFALLITDMTMPGLTGVELSEIIHTIQPNIPVILCTGYSELVNQEQARALGLQGYLMKPLRKQHLASTIRNVLDKS